MSYAGRSRLAINVQDFGALADSDQDGGGTDASVAINRAILSQSPGTNTSAGGSEVFLPDGFYRLSHPIHVPRSMTLRGSCAGNPNSGAILVPDEGVQAVVTDFGNTLAVGLYQDGSPLSIHTTVAGASIGQTLPQPTIEGVSTDGFSSSGTVMVQTAQGWQPVTYTGTTPTSFTGCPGETTVAAGSDGYVISTTPSDFQVAAVPAGWPTFWDGYLETDQGLQYVQWSGFSTSGSITTLTGFRGVHGSAGTTHTGDAVLLSPAQGTMLSTSAIVQGTPNVDGAWGVIKDLGITPASAAVYPQWAANTPTSVGTIVVPLTPFGLNPTSYCGNAFRCVASTGNTGPTEPDWITLADVPTAALQELTIVDGDVTWQIIELAHAIRLYEFTKIENVYVQDGGGDAIRGYGDADDFFLPSQCNLTRIDNCRAENMSGYALSLAGPDGSACLVTRMSGGACLAGGIYDRSFLGNTYVGCHMEENGSGYGGAFYEYMSVDPNAATLFVACYCEDGSFILQSPAMAINCAGFKYAETVPFSVTRGQYIGTGDNSPFLVTSTGTGTTAPQLGENDNSTVVLWTDANELGTATWRYSYAQTGASGTTSNLPFWGFNVYNNAAPNQYVGLVHTSAEHREGPAMALASRGICVGPLVGNDSGPLLSNASEAPSGPVSGSTGYNNQCRVGDAWVNPALTTNGIEKFVCDLRGGFAPTGPTGTWAADTNYFAGALVLPPVANGSVYRAVSSGTTGGSAPSFPETPGDYTALDGTVYWECLGSSSPTFSPAMFHGGRSRHDVTSADVTATFAILSPTEQLAAILEITDTGVLLSGSFVVQMPLWDGAQRTVYNGTLQPLAFESSSGTGPTVAAGARAIIYCDGTDWVVA
jgi:Pectate lyase superfamily protein